MAVSVGSAGEMKFVKRHGLDVEAKATMLSMCDVDFPLGTFNTSDCTIPGKHKRILDSRTCIEGTKAALATVHMDTFYVPAKEVPTYHCRQSHQIIDSLKLQPR